jgi:hypothetical protein
MADGKQHQLLGVWDFIPDQQMDMQGLKPSPATHHTIQTCGTGIQFFHRFTAVKLLNAPNVAAVFLKLWFLFCQMGEFVCEVGFQKLIPYFKPQNHVIGTLWKITNAHI